MSVTNPSPPEKPEAMAQSLLHLLESMGQASDPDVRALKPRLQAFLDETARRYERDGDAAAKAYAQEHAAIFEAESCLILLKTSRRLRDQLAQQARRVGNTSAPGKDALKASKAFGSLSDALELMLVAAKKDDAELRAAARARFLEVKQSFEGMARK